MNSVFSIRLSWQILTLVQQKANDVSKQKLSMLQQFEIHFICVNPSSQIVVWTLFMKVTLNKPTQLKQLNKSIEKSMLACYAVTWLPLKVYFFHDKMLKIT